MMKTIITLLMLSALFILGSCKGKKQTETVVVTPSIIEDTVKPEPVVKEVPEEKPVIKKNEKYFLIAGCFEYKELADKLVSKLQGEGYDAKIIPYFENLYLVSYEGFATQAEAKTTLDELKKEKGKEKTWIYKAGK